jgi:hypothetical protein
MAARRGAALSPRNPHRHRSARAKARAANGLQRRQQNGTTHKPRPFQAARCAENAALFPRPENGHVFGPTLRPHFRSQKTVSFWMPKNGPSQHSVIRVAGFRS